MVLSQRGALPYEAERALRTIFKRCVVCPDQQPACPSCPSNEICSLIPYDCNNCAHTMCIRDPQHTVTSSGPNVGAIAGGVVGGVAFVALLVFLIWRFWIKKRREEQDRELEEEWEKDEIAYAKDSMRNTMHDAASTRTRASLANSILSRASNIIQIAYIPGVTNRSGSGTNSLMGSIPVPPIPAAMRNSGPNPPKSPLSNQGDALFFRPGDLRDSTYSNTSSLGSLHDHNRDTQYTMQSITPSLARSSVTSEYFAQDVPSKPATTVKRALPRVVSVKSATSSNPATSPLSEEPLPQGKGVQVMISGQGDDQQRTGSQYTKAKKVTVGGKGRFPVRGGATPSSISPPSSSSSSAGKHAPSVPSPLAETDSSASSDSDSKDHVRARQSLIQTKDFASPSTQPTNSPFFDASEAALAAASSTSKPNPYASMARTVGANTTTSASPKKGGARSSRAAVGGGLSAILEDATKMASLDPKHEGLGGKGKRKQTGVQPTADPFGDENKTD